MKLDPRAMNTMVLALVCTVLDALSRVRGPDQSPPHLDHLGGMKYWMRSALRSRLSLNLQLALLKRVCHLVRHIGWRDLVRQALLGLKGLDHLVEHRLEHPAILNGS
jgi:hypothetical protein